MPCGRPRRRSRPSDAGEFMAGTGWLLNLTSPKQNDARRSRRRLWSASLRPSARHLVPPPCAGPGRRPRCDRRRILVITLYDNAFSPFARKVRMVLEHKRLAFEAVDGLAPAGHARLASVNPRVEVP